MFSTDPSHFRARRFFTKPREYFDKIPPAAPMDFQALAKITPTRYYHRPWLRPVLGQLR